MTLFIKDLVSIGAVDSGDNPEAEIVFWKRRKAKQPKEGGRMIDNFDLTGLPEDTAEALIAHVEVLKAERDAALEAVPAVEETVEIEKGLDDETAQLIAKYKSDLAAKDEELTAEIAKRRNTELVAKIKDDGLEPLLGSAVEVAPNLAALEAGAPEAFAAVYGNLLAAAQRVDLAKALGLEIGSAEAEATDPYEQRDAWVKKQLEAAPTADVNKLKADFWVAHPEAVAASREKK